MEQAVNLEEILFSLQDLSVCYSKHVFGWSIPPLLQQRNHFTYTEHNGTHIFFFAQLLHSALKHHRKCEDNPAALMDGGETFLVLNAEAGFQLLL